MKGRCGEFFMFTWNHLIPPSRYWVGWKVSFLLDQDNTRQSVKSVSTSPAAPPVVIQLLGHFPLFVTSWTAAGLVSLSFTISQSSSDSCPLNHWCYLTISPSATVFSFGPQSLPASGSFSISPLCISCKEYWSSKYWSFSFSISSSNGYSGLISFRIDWLDLLAVQGILESSPAPQFESINSLALSLLYGLSRIPGHGYWKFHSFEYTNFVSKIMSLLFNTLRCLGLSQLSFQWSSSISKPVLLMLDDCGGSVSCWIDLYMFIPAL